MASRMTMAQTTPERGNRISQRSGAPYSSATAAGQIHLTAATARRTHSASADYDSRFPAPRAAPCVTHRMSPTPRWPGQPEREAVAQDNPGAPSAQAPQPLVLVVEDEESIAETLAMIVEEVGCTPLIARNGREALALAQRHHPRLIITDLMLPYLTGTEFIAAARADAEAVGYPFPPVVVVTAASRARAEQAGADVVIPKPFDVLKVESEIQRLIERQPE